MTEPPATLHRMDPQSPAICTEELVKRYGKTTALAGLDLAIPPGTGGFDVARHPGGRGPPSRRELGGEPGLAHPAGPDKRDQPRVREQRLQLRQVPVTPDEAGARRGEVGGGDGCGGGRGGRTGGRGNAAEDRGVQVA